MSLLSGLIRKDVQYILQGGTHIKSVWLGAEKIWPMAKLYILNSGDEDIEYSVSNLTAATNANTTTTSLKIRSEKSDIKLPFSYDCSTNVRLTAATAGYTLSNTTSGAKSGKATLANNTTISTEENPDTILSWELTPNTTLSNRVSTIKLYDLMDNIDDIDNPENCDCDPVTIALTQRADTTLWDNATIVFYSDATCTTKVSSYNIDYNGGNLDVFFRIEAKRESGLTYYYGENIYSYAQETANNITLTRGNTIVATSASSPVQVNTATHCWKTTVAISSNEGTWGKWSEGSASYNTHATYNANSTQSVTLTNPKRTWVTTSAKSSSFKVTFNFTTNIRDQKNVTISKNASCTLNEGADNRTTSQTASPTFAVVNASGTSKTYYEIVYTTTQNVPCTAGSTSTISWNLPNTVGSTTDTYYVEYIMDPTYLAPAQGHINGQTDTTCNLGANKQTFIGRTTGTVSVTIVVRKKITQKVGDTSDIKVNSTSGLVTWITSNGDPSQLEWRNALSLTATTCAYNGTSSTVTAKATVNIADEPIYYKFSIKSSVNGDSNNGTVAYRNVPVATTVSPSTYSSGGSGSVSTKVGTITWHTNIGYYNAWTNNLTLNNVTFDFKSQTKDVSATGNINRTYNNTTQKSCVILCEAYAGQDAPTRQNDIVVYWTEANDYIKPTVIQDGSSKITASKEITCTQSADSSTVHTTQYESQYNWSLTTATGFSKQSDASDSKGSAVTNPTISTKITTTQNGGASGNAKYILDDYSGSVSIDVQAGNVSSTGGDKALTANVDNLTFTEGSSGTASSSRTTTLRVTGKDSSLYKECTLTQTGLSEADVTKPTSSGSYAWSKNNNNSTLSANGSTATLSFGDNSGSAPEYGLWTAWSVTGDIEYETTIAASGKTINDTGNFASSRTRTRTDHDTSSRSTTVTLKYNITGSYTGSVSAGTATITQSGKIWDKAATSEADSYTYEVVGTTPSGVTFTESTGTIVFSNNAVDSVSMPSNAKITLSKTALANSDTSFTASVPTTTSDNYYWATNVGSVTTSSRTSATITIPSNVGTDATVGEWGAWTPASIGSLTYPAGNVPAAGGTVTPTATPVVQTSTRTVTAGKSTNAKTINIGFTIYNSSSSKTIKVRKKAVNANKYSSTVTITQSGGYTDTSLNTSIIQSGYTPSNPASSRTSTLKYTRLGGTGATVNSNGVITFSENTSAAGNTVTIKCASVYNGTEITYVTNAVTQNAGIQQVTIGSSNVNVYIVLSGMQTVGYKITATLYAHKNLINGPVIDSCSVSFDDFGSFFTTKGTAFDQGTLNLSGTYYEGDSIVFELYVTQNEYYTDLNSWQNNTPTRAVNTDDSRMTVAVENVASNIYCYFLEGETGDLSTSFNGNYHT